MKTIAIIPARAGSKRLAGKNKLLLGGIPLIVHSIRYAKQNINIINEIYVTTDDKEIERISVAEGVKVITRPDHLSSDDSTTVSALKHVITTIDKNVENVILLQPTNPLRPKNLLHEAINKFKEGNYESLMAVSRNYQKFGKIKNEKFIPFNYVMGQRSQDLEPLYFENGLLYISKASLILNEKIMSQNNFPFIVDHPFAKVDIDVAEDLEMAEYFLNKIQE